MIKRTPPFLDGVREIIREFSQDGGDDTQGFDDDPVFLRERLLAISDTCKAYNVRSAANLLNELRSRPSSRQTKALLDKIDDYLILSEFEDAAETARQAAEMLED